MTDHLVLLISAGILILVIALVIVSRGSRPFSPYRRKRLMTQHETVMYHKLVRALSGTPYIVCPQVSMAAIMDVRSGIENRRRLGLRNRFDRKIVDFVIADADGHARLLVELDDSSHVLSRDRDRDEITRDAGYTTLRYRKAGKLDPRDLRRDIADIIRSQD